MEGVDVDVECCVVLGAFNAVAVGLAGFAESGGGCEVGECGKCVCDGHGDGTKVCFHFVELLMEAGHEVRFGHVPGRRHFGGGGFIDLDVAAGNAALAGV